MDVDILHAMHGAASERASELIRWRTQRAMCTLVLSRWDANLFLGLRSLCRSLKHGMLTCASACAVYVGV